uniref:Ig-like domain-containing protein n=1 Tax=Mesocestoides corti TaxID=53468 RepID=A0A5K3FTI1_MESCO
MDIGGVWNCTQRFENNVERRCDNSTEESNDTNSIVRYPGGDYVVSWLQALAPGHVRSYTCARRLSPIDVYGPNFRGVEDADYAPRISGTTLLEVSQTLHFATEADNCTSLHIRMISRNICINLLDNVLHDWVEG